MPLSGPPKKMRFLKKQSQPTPEPRYTTTVVKKEAPATTTQLTQPKSTTLRVFKPQDYNKGTQNRDTTPGVIKSLKENPAKGAKRAGIQATGIAGGDIKSKGGYELPGGKVAYDFGKRKGELAGEYKSTTFKTPGYQHSIPRKYELIKQKPSQPPSTPTEVIRSKGRFDRGHANPVPWVKGRKTDPGGVRAKENYSYRKGAKRSTGLKAIIQPTKTLRNKRLFAK